MPCRGKIVTHSAAALVLLIIILNVITLIIATAPQYTLVKYTDMHAEMKEEAMDICITAVEKYPSDAEKCTQVCGACREDAERCAHQYCAATLCHRSGAFEHHSQTAVREHVDSVRGGPDVCSLCDLMTTCHAQLPATTLSGHRGAQRSIIRVVQGWPFQVLTP